LTVSTRLILPSALPADLDPSRYDGEEDLDLEAGTSATEEHSHPLSIAHLSQHNLEHTKDRSRNEWIVVRIEVTDTGYGIRPKDMDESKLFCEF